MPPHKPAPLPLEVAMIKSLAEFEAIHRLSDFERLIYQRGFAAGHRHGLDTGDKIFTDALTQTTGGTNAD